MRVILQSLMTVAGRKYTRHEVRCRGSVLRKAAAQALRRQVGGPSLQVVAGVGSHQRKPSRRFTGRPL